jgi:hypothetical protein
MDEIPMNGKFKSGPTGPEIRDWYYDAVQAELDRKIAEALGVSKEQMNMGGGKTKAERDAEFEWHYQSWAKAHQMNNHTSTNSATGRVTKEINPGFKPTPKPKPRGVSIQTNVVAGPHVFEVMMPNGYYLADESGYPCNIGASHRDQSVEFKTVDEALAKFVRVAEKFREFYP